MSFDNIFDLLQQFGMPLLFALLYFLSQFFSKGRKQNDDPTSDPMDQAELDEFKRKAKEQLDRYLNQKKDQKQDNSSDTTQAQKTTVQSRQENTGFNTRDDTQTNAQTALAHDKYGSDALDRMRKQIKETQRQAEGYRKAITKQNTKVSSVYQKKQRSSTQTNLRPDFSQGSLKQAIVLTEVLGRPKALR